MATTFGQLKMKKAELKNKMKAIRDTNNGEIGFSVLSEYREVNQQVKIAESVLLK